MNIRNVQEMDLSPIQRVIEAAFPDEEIEVIRLLASDLYSESRIKPIRSLVCEVDNQVIGYVSFSPIFLSLTHNINGYILAPLAVLPDHQKKGVGSKLISIGIDILTKEGVDVLLVYGDPDYYNRFGFKEDIASPFLPPYPLKYPTGWQGILLSDINLPEPNIKFDCVRSLDKPYLW